MPAPTREILLSRYHYDPLDRLVDSTALEQSTLQRFYCKARLSCEIQGGVQRTVMQHDDQLLAQQQREGGKVTATLLATDQQRSVLNALDANGPNPLAYSPYGHRPPANGLLSLLGFNGERPDPVTGHYHLGNGCRQYNPVLMRFNSPDSWSPFGEGGLNAYIYCAGDPISNIDPSGHAFLKPLIKKLKKTNNAKLHAQTKFQLKASKKAMGGTKEIKKQAKANNMSPQNYFLEKTTEAVLEDSDKAMRLTRMNDPTSLNFAQRKTYYRSLNKIKDNDVFLVDIHNSSGKLLSETTKSKIVDSHIADPLPRTTNITNELPPDYGYLYTPPS